jgi:hypothetical protein
MTRKEINMNGSKTLYARAREYTTVERVALRSPIATLKAAIRIEDYAAEHTELRGYGKELRGRCPIHGGDNPSSFSVNVEEQIFHCFS